VPAELGQREIGHREVEPIAGLERVARLMLHVCSLLSPGGAAPSRKWEAPLTVGSRAERGG
jgi:hypothetical protein